jgi:hypothetical protein
MLLGCVMCVVRAGTRMTTKPYVIDQLISAKAIAARR